MTIDDMSRQNALPRKLSIQFFKALLESAPDAMIVIDESGVIVLSNGETERMFGYSREQIVGEAIEMLMPDRFRDKHHAHRDHYIAAPTLRPMGPGMALFGRRRNGDEFPVEISLSPLQTDAGTFVSSVIRDVTTRKKMESALVEARREAERANRANSAFLAAASHDLRQPVQALTLLNGALRRTVQDGKALQMLASQGKSLSAMTNLLNSLLDISRLDAGAVAPDIEDFPIDSLIDQLSSEFSRQAGQKGLTFDARENDAIVRSDPTMLTEIIQNLVSNSFRYTETGTVKLICKTSADKCRIEVRDTGIGIAPDHLDEIFNEFYQCKTSGSNSEGFGLGLAIVRRLVDLLDHTIEVDSKVGAGSCFCVTVPLIGHVNRHAATGKGADNESLSGEVNGVVLLVEDDEQVGNALAVLLETEGHTVVAAKSRAEAMTRLNEQEHRPDLIISDFHLAGSASGTETIASVRELFGTEIPALIITGDTSRVVDGAKRTPNCALLNKPIDPELLLQLVNSAILPDTVAH